MQRRRIGYAIAGMLCTMGMVAACSSSGSTSTSTSSTSSAGTGSGSGITLGFNDALSGDLSAATVPALDFAKAVVAYQNSKGGIDGRKITLQVLDSGNAGSGRAATNAVQLANSRANAILGPSVSNDCDEVVASADSNKVPTLCAFGDLADLQPPNPYIFLAATSETAYAAAMINQIKAVTGKAHPRIALINDYTQGSQQLAQKMQTIAPKLGASLVYVGTQSATATNLTSVIAGAIAARPDGIAGEIFANYVPGVVQQIRGSSLGSSVPIELPAGSVTFSEMQQLNDPHLYLFDGAEPLQPGAPGNTPEVKAILQQLAAEGLTTSSKILGSVGMMYIAAYINLMNALSACNGCSGAALSAQLVKTTTTVPGFVTDYGYSTSSHVGVRTWYFYTYDPKTKLLVPADTQAAGSLSLSQP
jgi:hypothetical protein